VQVTTKAFQFPTKHGLPFHFVSAADGTNVVAVFEEAISAALAYKAGAKDFVAEVRCACLCQGTVLKGLLTRICRCWNCWMMTAWVLRVRPSLVHQHRPLRGQGRLNIPNVKYMRGDARCHVCLNAAF
jgi:hypothetical protein